MKDRPNKPAATARITLRKTMKGFIAYRGTIGKKLADQMQRWPTAVLPSVEPFFAPWHTAEGSR